MLELSDIQGLVFSGYAKKPFAEYLMLEVEDAARARRWLRGLSQQITTGADRPSELCLNIAFTAHGLAALGLDDDALQSFPIEFREGMAGSETRSRALGDAGESDPQHWHWGSYQTPVHVMLMLYASTAPQLSAAIDAQLTECAGALRCKYRRNTRSLPERREHFGFADGIAQPNIQGAGSEGGRGMSIEPGEFILGYKNAYDKLPFVPNARPALDTGAHLAPCSLEGHRVALGRNGSYLVARQLDQDVAGFWDYMRKAAQEVSGPAATASDSAVLLASKCVGRWPSGAPLVHAPEQDDARFAGDNEFGYFWHDRDGSRCPVGSHIRRSNPRDSLEPDPFSSQKVVARHRILRRGRSYGVQIDKPWLSAKPDEVERGLFFMCVNANIRRQFEFIQQTWVNNPKFDGLYEERDPLIGNTDGTAGSFTIPATPARTRLHALPAFVRVRGGAYFFLPSVRALRFLAGLTAQA
jgi:Dyp-type peroxidase family